jgi:hypothetical protein
MSDTPQTDGFLDAPGVEYDDQWADFARKLERELAALRAALAASRADTDRMNLLESIEETTPMPEAFAVWPRRTTTLRGALDAMIAERAKETKL